MLLGTRTNGVVKDGSVDFVGYFEGKIFGRYICTFDGLPSLLASAH